MNIDLPFICRALPETNRLNVVIADASFMLPHPKRYPNLTQGMDKENLAENTIFFSAAQPGKTHADGTRRNSPFTAQLLKALGTSDMSLREIIQSVTDQVRKSTSNKQKPWHSKIHKPGLENEILIPKEVREWANQMNPAASQQHPQSFRDCEGCPDMVMVPPGRFMMGSPETEPGQFYDSSGGRREAPQLTVTIPQAFDMGKYEVTQAEFGLFALVSGYQAGYCDAWIRPNNYYLGIDFFAGNSMRFSWQYPGYAQWFDRPVTCINMPDAQAYVDWLSKKTGKKYRLPTEEEWEYAARAGTRSSRYWGDKSGCACRYANVADRSFKKRLPLRAWYQMHACDDGYYFTSPVGRFKPNQFGLYDMIGNAWEWTTSTWAFSGHYNFDERLKQTSEKNELLRRSQEDRKKRLEKLFILKGGSWNTPPYLTRSAYRIWDNGEQRYFTYGFRVVKEK